MERFHLITLSVAVVSLIVTLTLAGIALQFNSRQQSFPPSHDECPVGWSVGTKGRCTNGARGTDRRSTPSTTAWKSTASTKRGTHDVKDVDICVKKEWSNRRGQYWDGVTNYNGC